MATTRIPTMVRYMSKVRDTSDPQACWEWTGGKDKNGYGIFWDGTYKPSGAGNHVRVTRWAYKQFVGPLADNLNVCHTCDNPSCVNPAHFFAGSHKANHQDRERKGRGGAWRIAGESQWQAKLKDEQVLAIRDRYAAGGVSMAALGREFGVDAVMVFKIVHRKSWKHI